MKKNSKKLTLNAETVRTLSTTELTQVGGGATTAITCTCRTLYCTTAIKCTTAG